MNLLKWLFGSRKPKLNKSVVTISGDAELENKYNGFDIEHLPHANKYFPRYKGKYLFWWPTRENYSLEENITGCRYASTKEGAKEIIDKYLELRGVGSKIISVD